VGPHFWLLRASAPPHPRDTAALSEPSYRPRTSRKLKRIKFQGAIEGMERPLKLSFYLAEILKQRPLKENLS
jgi:hypothetical protein